MKRNRGKRLCTPAAIISLPVKTGGTCGRKKYFRKTLKYYQAEQLTDGSVKASKHAEKRLTTATRLKYLFLS